MAHKSSWTPEETAKAEQLLKIHPLRVVAEKLGRTEKSVRNKFYSNAKITRPGASLAEKSKGIIIKCMQCRNDFLSRCKINNRRCKECKIKSDGSASGHSLNLSAGRHGHAE